ncbi:hypothetical protein C8R47DRAFT_1225528 [Mycena vitilis]|nr:hypothetical protein C8R47DRAFT_1225528 [Mycena vitilis]
MSLPHDIPPYEFLERRDDNTDEAAVRKARAEALANPLREGHTTLGARRVPELGVPDAPDASTVTLRLSTILQEGVGGFSQVWKAEVVGAPTISLVMKVIQPSLCLYPWEEQYYKPWDLAHNETWVYQHLAHRQGLSIPYFFGLFEINTPCGENAWVLVLEFIPGRTVDQVAESGAIEDLKQFLVLGVNSVRDLRLDGWSLVDVRGPNFLLTGEPGAWNVVMIELFDARYRNERKSIEAASEDQMYGFFWLFIECIRGYNCHILPWAREHRCLETAPSEISQAEDFDLRSSRNTSPCSGFLSLCFCDSRSQRLA